MDKIPILLLAAGNSSRMGSPKQLLPWGNQTLIEHQIETLLESDQPVNVVLGANSKAVIPLIKKFEINVFINKNWEKGMGSSIASGICQLSEKSPSATGVLITLLDQPLITATHIKKMATGFTPGNRQIIVSQSASGWRGVPVIFDKIYFEELGRLDGEKGAKILIQRHKQSVTEIACGEILEDMDTPESYQKMIKKDGII
ncbi:NTP transferase domain-containing protein [Maribellus comscasis]|uniref:NTP transferase domain-containing protein n=1 Tax=Maribellus comscasis TaxID=2681766 RepID=A0A6I6JSH6_9BACT|nr:nucleotidyltransferase family protein [Maribellus comscasis]QGY45966.1 NTP transferase domain-containing protein [Maribellus comscasis]